MPLFAIYQSRLGQESHVNDISAHMPELHYWARGYRWVRILEIGVRTGNSTSAFLAALELDGGGDLWSIDIDDTYVPLEWRRLMPRWHFLKADSLSAEAAAWVPRELDVLFLDGDHAYERCLGELRAYGPRVVKGGVILCHDTLLRGEVFGAPADPKYPVAAAISQWCHETKRTWEQREGHFGLGVIRIS